MEAIKSIKGFIDPPEATALVGYINHLEQTKPDAFNMYQDGKRASLQFGHDLHYGLDPSYKFFKELDLLGSEEDQEMIKGYCLSIVAKAKEIFAESEDMYVSAFWLAKQYPGATIPLHDDTDGGYNVQYIYSAILYLNEIEQGGELSFVDLGYSYKPEVGDLVLFPTQTTGAHTVAEIPEERYSLVMWLTKDKTLAVLG